jgi:putative ABC transport system permease protein
LIEALGQDLRQAARSLLKSPDFTSVAVLTLAVGMGASASIFSVVDAVLLHPLPYAQPDRLVVMWQRDLKTGTPVVEISYGEFEAWKAAAPAFEGMAAMTATNFRVNLTGRGEPVPLEAAAVSGSFFELLGVTPIAGRSFRPDEDRPGGTPVAMLREGFWRRQLSADPAVVGGPLTLDGTPTTIVGIVPDDVSLPKGADAWFPAGSGLSAEPVRSIRILKAVARLGAATRLDQARAEMDLVAERQAEALPKENAGFGIHVAPLSEQVYGDTRHALLLLLAAVGLVTLIACANVANLHLARGADRESELALRLAIGASRARLVRQLLVESLLLSLLAGAAGLLIAWWSVTALVARVPADVPRLAHVGVDLRVFAFCLALCALTALLIGLLPALRAAATQPADTLREGTRRASEALRGRRLRAALVVGELALSLALLAGAALTGRSLFGLLDLDPGFDPAQTVTARLGLPDKYATREDRTAFFEPLLERLGAIPGVEAAGLVLLRPLSDPIGWDYDFTVEGQTSEQQERNPPCNYEAVSADYFRAMRIPLARGRVFGPEDGPEGGPVAIVSRALAERFWPGQDALGRRLKFGPADGDAPWHSVVGVVGDVRNRGWTDMWLDAYVPYQRWSFGRMDLVLRTSVDPQSVVPAFRRAVYAGDPEVPLADVTTMDAAVEEATAGPRFTALLLGLFAGVAVLLAAVGLYAVMAGTVARRTRELGVRMALGAGRGALLRLVVVDAFRLTAGGIAIGLCLALAGGRALHGLLYDVRPSDPSTLAATALLLAAVALLASALPARRATRVDPMSALRYE